MPKVDLPSLYDVRLRLSADAPEHPAHILDVDPESVLLRVPRDLMAVDSPDVAILSYGYKNFQWEFTAPVRAIYDAWWFLDRPEDHDCKRFQRRAFVRIGYETDLTAIPTDENGKQTGSPFTFRTANLSAGGCFVESDHMLGGPGDHMMVMLALPGLDVAPTLSQVVRSHESDLGNRYGIHFRGLSGAVQEQVVQFVTRQIRENLQKGQSIVQVER